MTSLNGLVCYYNFELPNQLQNLISGGSLSVSGTVTHSGSAKYGTYSLSSRSGTTSYSTSTDSGLLSLGNFCTLSVWFNPASVPQTSRLLNISNSSGVCIGCGISSYGVFYDIAGTVVSFSESSAEYIGFGSGWNHLVVTYSMSVAGTTNIGVYLNGVMIQNPSTTAAANIWRTSPGTPTTLTFFGTANNVNSTTCNVDEVMIFNRALSINEAMNLYNVYNNNYTELITSGQTSLRQSSYGSTSIIADRLLSSGGITTNGQITTNNNNINAGLGTITCGNLNLISYAAPTVSGGFVSTVGTTGGLTCGQITSTGNITATGKTLTCGAIACNSVSSTPLIVERSSVSSSGFDISVSGNFVYILYGSRIDKYDVSTNQSTTITPNPAVGYMDKIANYQEYSYVTQGPNRVFKIDANGNLTEPFVNVGANSYYGLCIYNGILYLGVMNSTTCIRAYDLLTNQPLAGFTNPVAGTTTQYFHVSISNNIIYGTDFANNRVSTFNATTGAIINLNFITGLTNLNAVESDGSILYVLRNSNIIYAYSLGGMLISTLLSVPAGGLRCIRVYGGNLYVVSSSSVKTYQIVGTGSLSCGKITSSTIITNNSDINAGSGALTSGSITTGAISATGLTCGTITTTGALNAIGQTITCATLNGNLASTYITGTIPASQVIGLSVTSSLAASTITPGTLNIGSSNSLTCGPISSTTITTNNNNINAGTGTLACGALTSTTITTNNNNINAGTGTLACGAITTTGALNATGQTLACGALTSTTITTNNNNINAGTGTLACGALTASGAITATGQTLACGALTSTTITTNNNNINAGTGTLACGAITTTGALNAAGQTITAGSLTSGNVNFSGTRSGIYWGYGGSKIYDDGDLTVESDGSLVMQLNATGGTSGTFQIRSQNRSTGGTLSCGAITATGAITTGSSDVNAGTGTLTCGIINATGAINASTSTVTCATLSGNLAANKITAGTLNIGSSNSLTCGAISATTVTASGSITSFGSITGSSINIGSGALVCGGIVSSGGINASASTVTCATLSGNLAATKITGTLTDSQLAGISASKITGTLADSQLAAIAASKITGTLADSQLAGISASKITGTLADSQLAAIAASKITGTLTDSQLAGIAANKITSGILNIGSSSSLTCGAITSSSINTGSGAVNAGTGTLTCGIINASGAINASASTITCATLSGNLAASKITGTLADSQLAGIAANKITAGALNIGSSNTLNCGAITSTTINTNNNNINAGTGTLTCGALTSTTINTNNNNINAGTGTLTCGALTSTTITTNNNAINAGNGALSCGKIICEHPTFYLLNADNAQAQASIGLVRNWTRLDIAWNWRAGYSEVTYINNTGGGHLFLYYPASGVTFAPVTSGGFYNASDRKLKRNIMKVLPSLENILKLNPVTFNYIHDESDAQVHSGFVAQDLEEVFPNCVSTNPSEDINQRIKTINMSEIIPYIVKSIQEQHDIVVSQQSQITELKSTVASQQSQIDSLTQQLADLKALVQTLIPSP